MDLAAWLFRPSFACRRIASRQMDVCARESRPSWIGQTFERLAVPNRPRRYFVGHLEVLPTSVGKRSACPTMSLSFLAMRASQKRRSFRSVALQITRLVEHKIRKPTSAIADESPRAGIDEIGEENAVARFHFRPNRVGRVPGVIGYGERVTGIR